MKRHTRRVLALVGFTVGATLLGVEGHAAPPSTKVILQCLDRTFGASIVAADLNGGKLTLLNRPPEPSADEGAPVLSSDRQKVAFVRNRRLYVMNVDGSNLTLLTKHDMNDAWRLAQRPVFSFSPDGTKILFVDALNNDNPELFVVATDGSAPTQLTHLSRTDVEFPVFRPDGREILFMSNSQEHKDQLQIYMMGVDGSHITALTTPPGQSRFPAFSPDGRRLVFESNRTGTWQVFLMNADGSGVKQLTQPPGENISPIFTDAEHIVFLSAPHLAASRTDGALSVIDIKGPGIRKLYSVSLPGEILLNFTARDGKVVFITQGAVGLPKVYGINIDGSKLTLLGGGLNCSNPSLGPLGRPW